MAALVPHVEKPEMLRSTALRVCKKLQLSDKTALFGREFGVFDSSGWALDLGVVLS